MRISRKIPRSMMPRDGSPGPTRRIESRNPIRVIQLIPSVLMGCLVPCESKGEADHWMTVEADGSIVSARAQPDPVYWDDNGTVRRHVADAKVHFEDGRVVLREVKPLARLSTTKLEELSRRTDIVTAQLAKRGWGYEVVDSGCPRFQRRVAVAQQIYASRRLPVPPGLPLLVAEAVTLLGADTLGKLERLIPGATRPQLLALVLHRFLAVELDDGPISNRTPVRIPQLSQEQSRQ